MIHLLCLSVCLSVSLLANIGSKPRLPSDTTAIYERKTTTAVKNPPKKFQNIPKYSKKFQKFQKFQNPFPLLLPLVEHLDPEL